MIHRILLKNRIRYAVIGILGSQAGIYDRKKGVTEETIKTVKDHCVELFKYFDTQKEAEAYLQGLNDMLIWHNYSLTLPSHHFELFGTDIEFI